MRETTRVSKFRIRERTKQLGKKNSDVVDALREYGINVSECNYSHIIYGDRKGPQAEHCIICADKIVKGWENNARED